MKASLALSLILLALGGFFGWRQHERLKLARETHHRAEAEVRASGLSPESLATFGKQPFSTRRDREDTASKTTTAKALAGELISWKSVAAGSDTDRAEELMDQLLDLNPNQIKTVIAEIQASTEIDNLARKHLTELSLNGLSWNHPQAALELLIESSDVAKMTPLDQHIISNSLQKWAGENPLGALNWFRKHGENHPELITDRTKAAVIAGIATQDPKQALSLIGEMKLENKDTLASSVAFAVSTPDEYTALLTALRDFEKNDAEFVKKTLGGLAYRLAYQDFEATKTWLSSAKLSDQEIRSFSEGLSYSCTQADTGHWIDWLADKLPADQFSKKVGKSVWEWTEADYKAAGEWMNGSADGPSKEAAVWGYAGALASHQPESAAQWALTLPEGKERDKLLKGVHAAWKKKDPAAAAGFALEHRLGN